MVFGSAHRVFGSAHHKIHMHGLLLKVAEMKLYAAYFPLATMSSLQRDLRVLFEAAVEIQVAMAMAVAQNPLAAAEAHLAAAGVALGLAAPASPPASLDPASLEPPAPLLAQVPLLAYAQLLVQTLLLERALLTQAPLLSPGLCRATSRETRSWRFSPTDSYQTP